MTFQQDITIFADRRALAAALASHVAKAAHESSIARGRFCVALSGGSLMKMLAPALISPCLSGQIDWSTWHVFWVDERWVPHDSLDSNVGVARKLLFSHVVIPDERLHAIDDSRSPGDIAQAYELEIREVVQIEVGALPRFDMVLLGLGADGHTASLFPRHPALRERRRWVVPVFNAPKAPGVRVTMTLPVINAAHRIVFVATGSGKASIVAELLNPSAKRPNIPASLVKPTNGKMHWFVDHAAASKSNLTTVESRFSTTGSE